MARHYHINNGGTNLTSNTSAGATTSPVNAVPSITVPFYAAFDATNINGHYEEVEITGKTATNINHAATTYDHTTAEEVRFPFVKTEADEFSAKLNGATAIPGVAGADGWQSVSDTWTYASASTITVPSGAATYYKKGDKIKLTQTTAKYFYITDVADTVLTVTGGSDYSVANAAITSPYYSHQTSPIGFPDSFAWAGAASGFSSTTTAVYNFSLNGTVAHVAYEVIGTSNSTSKGLTLPIAAKNATNEIRFPVYIVDNGTSAFGRAEIQPNATSVPFATTAAGAAFTGSGSCQLHGSFSYLIK